MSTPSRIEELLLRWDELHEQGQQITLEELCRDNPELLPDVRRELRRLGNLRALLDVAHAGEEQATPPPGDADSAGTSAHGREEGEPVPAPAAGRYRLVRFHARGGLGEVFEAEDAELRRRVALKRIKPAWAGDAESRRRFLREAEITACLEHPGVVPVFGLVQAADGQPCYAMRFVQGETLLDALRRFHEADRPGRDPGERSLAMRGLLNRFVAVCNTIAYAHSQGVLHRDLKPQNILLGAYGETLVVDWGLAKVVASGQGLVAGEEDASSSPATSPWPLATPEGTVPGLALGTPAYMSPEQAAGRWDEVGPASDLYSLGATLYMLLTGRPPFQGPHLLDRVERGEFQPPREVKKDVPAALEAVCLKALALRPTDRYPTVAALAADVEQWLADEPVSVCGEPRAVRARRWVRKHPGPAAAAAAAILVGLVGLAVGAALLGWKNQQLFAANEQLELAHREAEQKSEQAGRARDRTFQALDAMTSGITGESLQTRPALSAEQKKFLAEVLNYYQEFASEQGEDEGTRKRIAAAASRVGLIHARLGNREAGVRASQQALDSYAKLAADSPGVRHYRQGLAQSHNNLGILFEQLGQRREAEAALRQALALKEQLAAEFPAEPDYRQELARSQDSLGVLLEQLGKRSEAEAAYRHALEMQVQLTAEFPTVPAYRQGLAASRNNLGNLLRHLGKRPEAEAEYRQALAVQELLATEFPAVPEYRQELARSHNNLGLLLEQWGQRREAETAFRRALAVQAQLATEFPAAPAYRQELAGSHNNLGILLKQLGKPAEAEAAYRRALAVQEQLAADFPTVPEYRRELARSQLNLGSLLPQLGKRPEAEEAYRQALALYEKVVTDSPAVPRYRQELAISHANLGSLLLKLGQRREAESLCRRAVALQEQLATDFPAVPAHRRELAASHTTLGAVLFESGQRPEAEAAFRQALALREKLVAEFPAVPAYRADLAASQVHVGNVLRSADKSAEALAWYDRALALLSPLVEAGPRLAFGRQIVRDARWGRAVALDQVQRPADAVADWDQAVQLSPGPERAALRAGRARSLLHAGQLQRALAEVADLAKAPAADAPHLVDLACVYTLAAGRDTPPHAAHIQEALHLLRRAVAGGFKDAERLRKDDHLKLLRDHAEFQKLLAELQGK